MKRHIDNQPSPAEHTALCACACASLAKRKKWQNVHTQHTTTTITTHCTTIELFIYLFTISLV